MEFDINEYSDSAIIEVVAVTSFYKYYKKNKSEMDTTAFFEEEKFKEEQRIRKEAYMNSIMALEEVVMNDNCAYITRENGLRDRMKTIDNSVIKKVLLKHAVKLATLEFSLGHQMMMYDPKNNLSVVGKNDSSTDVAVQVYYSILNNGLDETYDKLNNRAVVHKLLESYVYQRLSYGQRDKLDNVVAENLTARRILQDIDSYTPKKTTK